MARIELWNGDICDLEVDAIVNPANLSLWMATGVGGAIKLGQKQMLSHVDFVGIPAPCLKDFPVSHRDFEIHLFLEFTQHGLFGGLALEVESKRLVGLDSMNLWIDITLDELRHVLRGVDILKIDDAEARQLSGEYNLRKAAAKILDIDRKTLSH